MKFDVVKNRKVIASGLSERMAKTYAANSGGRVRSNPVVEVKTKPVAKKRAAPVKRANPIKPKREAKSFYWIIESVPRGRFEGQYLSAHYSREEIVKLAQTKADKYGVQAKIRELHT